MNALVGTVIFVAAVVLFFALLLLQNWLRERRCPHHEVRMVRQQKGYEFYFVEVCMACGKRGPAKP